MRILFLTNHLEGTDGWSRVALDYITELQNLGFNVLCLTHKTSSQKKIKEHALLETPLKYMVNPLVSFSTALRIKRKIAEFSPDIIHFTVEPYATILPFLISSKTKFFLTVHGTYSVPPILFDNFLERTVSQFLSKKYYRKLDGIVTVSNYTKNHLINYYPKLKDKIKVITNGINLEKHRIVDLDQKIKNETKKILFVGAVKRRKGILQTIEALKYYRDNFSDNFIYEIVGDYNQRNDYYQKVLKKIKDYNLDGKVFFQGKIVGEELQEYYSNADLFIMTSVNINNHFEGFGLVFLEANAKGVPSIGSTNSGCEEAILNNKTGYVMDPSNFKEVAEKIDLILNKNSIKKQDCIDWAKENDIKIKTKELINFYQEINSSGVCLEK